MEPYTTGTGQKLLVHNKADCKGDNCVIHNPSNHCMIEFPTHWRADRHLMERICPHGIGHPDPDDFSFKKLHMNPSHSKYESMHGCDGCCSK